MSILKYAAGFIMSAALLTACIQPIEQQSDVPRTIITEHLRAFNAGDVEAMAKMQHPDIQWLSVKGNEIVVEVSGREALSKSMSDYFRTRSQITSRLRDWNVNDPYVSVTEVVNWTGEDGKEKYQSSLTVYELEDNSIRRVWYYPAVKNKETLMHGHN